MSRFNWSKLLLAAGTVAFCLVGLEAAVRILDVPGSERSPEFVRDEELGWVRPPNQGRHTYLRNFSAPNLFRVHFRTNSRGWRDKEYPLAKGDKLRILALGDSITEGWGVEEDESYPNVLEERFLCGVEVWNLGVDGYSTDQEYLQLRRVIAEYKPDLVTLGFYLNDILPNIRPSTNALTIQKPLLAFHNSHLMLTNRETLTQQKLREAQRKRSLRARLIGLLNRSALFGMTRFAVLRGLYILRSRLRDTSGPQTAYEENPNLVPMGPEVKRAWDMTERILVAMNELCKQNQARFVLTYVPSTQEIFSQVLDRWITDYGVRAPRSAFDVHQTERTLAEIARRNGLHFVELGVVFRNNSPPEQLYLPDLVADEHLSARGHVLVADTLAEYFREHHLLPDRNFCRQAAAEPKSP